jgi:crossover junction endodeoxyribonuclease RuvC
VRVLGVDPSLHMTGYGVVESTRDSLKLVEGGVISPGSRKALPERLAELQRGLADVIDTLRPDAMVVEEVFSQTAYPRTAILMAHARGALVCAAALAGVPVYDLAPTAVKRALVGRGGATKEQVASMVMQGLGLRKRPSPADVTDALALAIAYVRRNGRR